MSDGVHQSLPQGALRQLQPLVSSLGVWNERGVQFGLKVGHHVLVDGVQISAKLFAVEDIGLGVAAEDGAGHSGLKGETGNVVGQQPSAGVCYTGVFDQMQIFQHRHRVQPRIYASALRKLGPTRLRDLDGRVEGVAGSLIQPDKTFLEEEVPNLVAGHLLAGGALPNVESAPEGVGLAVLPPEP